MKYEGSNKLRFIFIGRDLGVEYLVFFWCIYFLIWKNMKYVYKNFLCDLYNLVIKIIIYYWDRGEYDLFIIKVSLLL